jgi:hypothetical protein
MSTGGNTATSVGCEFDFAALEKMAADIEALRMTVYLGEHACPT